MVAVGVGSIEQERNGEAAGSPGVGVKAIGGTEPIFSWCLLLETRGVPRALLRPLLIAICFAFVPQKYPIKARVQAEPPSCWGEHVLFADAAPVGPDSFCVGLFLPLGGMRTFQCPRWVTTLQAAELWGWVQGVRLAADMQWPRVCVGSDITVARCQIQGKGVLFFVRASHGYCGPCCGFDVGLGSPLRAFMHLLVVIRRIRLVGCMSLTL